MEHALKVTKYQIHDIGKAMLRFYLVMMGVVVGLFILGQYVRSAHPGNVFNMNGLDLSTAVFLFVAGLNCFKPSFKFASANGVSRKRFFRENILALLGMAGLAAAIDSLLTLVYASVVHYRSIYSMLYPGGHAVGAVLWLFCVYAASIVLGWFINLLYYRSGKQLKLLISLSPVIVSITLSTLNGLTGGIIGPAVQKFIIGFWGLKGMSPYAAVMSLSLTIVLLGSLIFLMIRRAPVKN